MKRDQELRRLAVAKSLDLPYDEMRDISVKKEGIGALGLLGVAAGAGLPGIILAGLMLWNRMQPESPPVQPEPADTEYEVLFYDAEGNPIKVPHVNERPENDQ